MEINITRFVKEACPMKFSASIMEMGPHAGQITWQNAKDETEFFTFLDTDDKKQAARAYFGSFGAWDEDEINDWDDTELNALFLQEISGALREFEAFDSIKEAMESDQCSGRLYQCDVDGEEKGDWFFLLDS